MAPVTESTVTTQGSPSKPTHTGRHWRPSRVLLFGAAISLTLMLAAVVFWRIGHARQNLTWQQELRQFTSLPGVETMPAFSPDGRQLAYVHSERDPLALHFLGRQMAQANIYVKLIEAGTELRVTNHPGADYHPAWSPNGEYIAFYRDLARLAFPVLTATPALAVSRDGQHLAYSQIDSMEADIMLLQKLNR